MLVCSIYTLDAPCLPCRTKMAHVLVVPWSIARTLADAVIHGFELTSPSGGNPRDRIEDAARVASAMEPIAPREPFRSLSGERHKTSWPLGPRPPLRVRGGGGRGLRRDGERE